MKTCIDLRDRILREVVRSDRLSVGARLPTVQKLARHYSVSPTTVGKAIALLESEGWITKRRGSGIYVAAAAGTTDRNARSRRCRIGCIIQSLSHVLTHRFFEGVERFASRRTWIVEVATTNWRISEELRQIALMKENGVQGIVLYPTPYRDAESEYLHHQFTDYPIVVADLYQPGMKRPHVIFDNWTAGYEMTRHLFEQNHQAIAFLKFSNEISYRSVDDRMAGYRAAMEEIHAPFNPTWIIPYGSMQPGSVAHLTALEHFCAITPLPTALIVPDDYHAPPTIQFLRSRGIKVPDDVLVAGFDNHQQDSWSDRFPTTNPDFVNLGERTAQLLHTVIKKRATSTTEVFLPCPLHLPTVSHVQNPISLPGLT